MNRSHHDQLLKELLADESLEMVRHQSLERGMAAARRRRQRAGWTKGGLISVLLLAALWLLIPTPQRPAARNQVAHEQVTTNPATVATVVPSVKVPASVRFISDDELLALFPGRSLALLGPPGRKTLVFLDQPSVSDHNQKGSKP